MANRQILTRDDLDYNLFKIIPLSGGDCLITLNGLDLSASICDELGAIDINCFGDICVDDALETDVLIFNGEKWIPSDLMGPIAAIAVTEGQVFNDVDISLGYIAGPLCSGAGVQTFGDWHIYDGMGTEVFSGNDFAGTINLDFSSVITISSASYPDDFTFTGTYQVGDACGISEVAEFEFEIVPELKEVFGFVGTDQAAQAPAWANRMEVKTWGAGAGGDNRTAFGGAGYGGGTGDFRIAEFNVSPLEQFSVVVGQASFIGITGSYVGYGFGGAGRHISGQQYGPNGGGLTGIFTGTGTVLASDTGRALLISGGGGAAIRNSPVTAGNSAWHGGDPATCGDSFLNNSPFTPTDMQGMAFPTNVFGYAGGGGGFLGGGASSSGSSFGFSGLGGCSYTDPSAISSSNITNTGKAPNGAGAFLPSPGNADPDYNPTLNQNGTASNGSSEAFVGGHGLLVITWKL